MTKKKINIILLLVVLGLWGAVLYRFAKNYFFTNDIVPIAKSSNLNFDTKMQFKDTFEMKAITRDPFLNRQLSTANSLKAKYPSYSRTPVVKKAPPIKKQVPFMEYYGYIKSGKGSGKELIMVKNNGVLFKLKLGEERDGLKILKIFKDSIQITFNNEKYYVRKK